MSEPQRDALAVPAIAAENAGPSPGDPAGVAPGTGPDRRALDDRRTTAQPSERMIGRVVACTGARATIATSASSLAGTNTEFWSIGKLISIGTGATRIVGLVYEMNTDNHRWTEGEPNIILVQLELLGEIIDKPGGGLLFKRGISVYPPLGAVAHRIRASDLRAAHDLGDKGTEIGTLAQDSSIPATVSIEDMLKRHFAVVGTTGVGKSTSVSILVRKACDVRQSLRVLVLDPHNEYTNAFGDIAVTLDAAKLELPYWMFRFDELSDVIFRGRIVEAESDILRDLIPLAKARARSEAMSSGIQSGLMKRSLDTGGITADTPVPYRMIDLLKLVDEELGLLEPRFARTDLRSLKYRLESLVHDARFRFMFGKMTAEDSMDRVISRIFRIPDEGRRVTVVQLASLPSEVLNAVASVLARLAFDVAVFAGGAFEVLVLCEEAHRYVPVDARAGFGPTRLAIAKIAKEGRKYGCYLGVVTQRPGELDPTILSQCSTVFAMRLGNDRDQEIIRAAISDSSASTVSFLSSIERREAIAFGEGVATPMRMRFMEQKREHMPATAADMTDLILGNGRVDVWDVIGKMRGSMKGGDTASGEISFPPDPVVAAGWQPAAPAAPPRPQAGGGMAAPPPRPALRPEVFDPAAIDIRSAESRAVAAAPLAPGHDSGHKAAWQQPSPPPSPPAPSPSTGNSLVTRFRSGF
jgi:hypothetical protein